jgi:hypothetical protein
MTKGATAVERYSAGESAPKIAEQLGVTSGHLPGPEKEWNCTKTCFELLQGRSDPS